MPDHITYRAIVLGNGRKLDWDAIAEQLQDALAKAEPVGETHAT